MEIITTKKVDDSHFYQSFDPILWRPLNFIRRHRVLFHLAKGFRALTNFGIKGLVDTFSVEKRSKKSTLETETALSKEDRLSEEKAVFAKQIKISIVAELSNTQEQFLKEMIESVIAQTYSNWELCLAVVNVNETLKNFAQKDNRIKYIQLDRDFGVSGNLNKAIEASCGEYICVLDSNDILHPSVLHEVMKAICNDADFIYTDEAVFSMNNKITLKHYKPDYAVDTLYSYNYIGHFMAFNRKLAEKDSLFRSEFDRSYDYDFALRYTDIASKVYHISKLLYFMRNYGNSALSDSEKVKNAVSSSENAIRSRLKSKAIQAKVESKPNLPGFFRVSYELKENPLISIIIPNKDNVSLLRNCLSSIIEKTTYKNYEIIIVENNSTKKATFDYYEELKRYSNINVVYCKIKGFNYSEVCNFGFQHANGEQLVFLNNDVQMITPNWIEEMLMYSQRSDVGIVGMKLYFINGTIQHAGIILGMGETGGHIFYGACHDAVGYMAKLQIVQNMSAVSAACIMIKKRVFEEAGLFDTDFAYSFNDVDLCLKARKTGLLIVWTPYAEAYHLESRSRGYNTTPQKSRLIAIETEIFKARWEKEIALGDPYYNRGLSLDMTEYSRNSLLGGGGGISILSPLKHPLFFPEKSIK